MWGSNKYKNDPDVIQLRRKLKDVFQELRKEHGFIARMNYLCCSTCAGYALWNQLEETVKKGRKRPEGITYWHRQDEDGLWDSGHIYLAYGGTVESDDTKIELDATFKVGVTICKVLCKHGVKYQWSGDPTQRIKVKAW